MRRSHSLSLPQGNWLLGPSRVLRPGTHDKSSQEPNYQLGDWVLVRFPQDEIGRQHKLSRPWHGPYRIVDRRDPHVTVVKVYAPQDDQIQVHQTRVSPCPPELPAGFFWYGSQRTSPGRPLLDGQLFTPKRQPLIVEILHSSRRSWRVIVTFPHRTQRLSS